MALNLNGAGAISAVTATDAVSLTHPFHSNSPPYRKSK